MLRCVVDRAINNNWKIQGAYAQGIHVYVSYKLKLK